jgi:hypothetical protein
MDVVQPMETAGEAKLILALTMKNVAESVIDERTRSRAKSNGSSPTSRRWRPAPTRSWERPVWFRPVADRPSRSPYGADCDFDRPHPCPWTPRYGRRHPLVTPGPLLRPPPIVSLLTIGGLLAGARAEEGSRRRGSVAA